uniref:Uncharacterized protein n=1 Tax=Pipistrellus kuhlii TaxID=59472 RepID=A0A7J7UTU4_PIPKU|nr:hypothetical protein mPipKuh1_008713 [Pipistrellus kuhlii]
MQHSASEPDMRPPRWKHQPQRRLLGKRDALRQMCPCLCTWHWPDRKARVTQKSWSSPQATGERKAPSWGPGPCPYVLAHLAAWMLFAGRMQRELVPAGPAFPVQHKFLRSGKPAEPKEAARVSYDQGLAGGGEGGQNQGSPESECHFPIYQTGHVGTFFSPSLICSMRSGHHNRHLVEMIYTHSICRESLLSKCGAGFWGPGTRFGRRGGQGHVGYSQ